MKQFVVALLAAFALSSPAFAGSIDYSTGNFVSAKFTGSFLSSINIDIKGNLHEVDINTGTLIKNTGFCPSGWTCFDFTGGSVSVDGGKIFIGAITGGITMEGNGIATVAAKLVPMSGGPSGAVTADFSFSGNRIHTASANVIPSAVPEPTAFSLLGMGLVSFLVFRRMKASS